MADKEIGVATLIEQVRLLLHTVDWDEHASDTEIMQSIDWEGLRSAYVTATADPDSTKSK
jgi:hypothetical protein